MIETLKELSDADREQRKRDHPSLYYKNLSIINISDEEWIDIKDYEGHYQISNKGRVKSLERWTSNKRGIYLKKAKILKTTLKRNYIQCALYKNDVRKPYAVNRVVAQHFVLNPENKPQVNHLNGIKTDNRAINLEWVTASENHIHAWTTGLQPSQNGENNPLAKLTNKDVFEIRKLLAQKILSNGKISKIFNVAPATIYRIKFNICWSHLK